ncbi:syntaxin-121-like [Cucurbita moschata]|uniref:Syntaxin-121-like n=1 Tax=Cucurbita moschata TaxID=3662 RepID=A0A6J1HH98_CUCMO|nr:syntaxin-121-like [Cucurbita moschata]
MNDLFSSDSFRRDPHHHSVEMAPDVPSSTTINLNNFFEDVESVKAELAELERLHRSLQNSHEHSKTLHNSKAIKDLRSRMESDLTLALKKARFIKLRLEELDRSNTENRNLPGCGYGSSADRSRTSVVNGLRKNLCDSMENFNRLREEISSTYKETIERRYFTITGENPDEKTIDLLISTGESETFLQKAIQKQGKGKVLETIQEIQERHDAVKDIEKNLKELHQVFMDMAVLVQTQGQHLDDIESQVTRANSAIKRGATELQTARHYQKNTRKWMCIGVAAFIFILFIIILSVVLANKK